MRKIICVSILVFVLCAGIGLAESKFEVGVFTGSYQPFGKFNQGLYTFRLKGDYMYGYELGYQLSPEFRIQIQLDSFNAVASSPAYSVWYEIETQGISILPVFDLWHCRRQKIYGGIGVISREIRILKCTPSGSVPYSFHNFGFPSGIVSVVGWRMSYQFVQLKGEIQYITRTTGGKLLNVPLDWDGFKFTLGIGIKF